MNTKERIIEEAFREFLTKGYKGADVVTIAQRAGVTKGGLYYYFKSKGVLAEAVLEFLEIEIGGRVYSDLMADVPFVLSNSLVHSRASASQLLGDVASVLTRLANEVPRTQKGVHKRIASIMDNTVDRLTLSLQRNRMHRPRGLATSADELALLICSAALGSVTLSQICGNRCGTEQMYATLEQIVHGELTIEMSQRKAV